jgi:hypothetical protein
LIIVLDDKRSIGWKMQQVLDDQSENNPGLMIQMNTGNDSNSNDA